MLYDIGVPNNCGQDVNVISVLVCCIFHFYVLYSVHRAGNRAIDFQAEGQRFKTCDGHIVYPPPTHTHKWTISTGHNIQPEARYGHLVTVLYLKYYWKGIKQNKKEKKNTHKNFATITKHLADTPTWLLWLGPVQSMSIFFNFTVITSVYHCVKSTVSMILNHSDTKQHKNIALFKQKVVPHIFLNSTAPVDQFCFGWLNNAVPVYGLKKQKTNISWMPTGFSKCSCLYRGSLNLFFYFLEK